jgi:S1-C subfamily serine protease
MMINRIYPGSPAAREGLVEGDILLTVAVPEAPWPIELTVSEREDYGMPDFDEADIPREFEAMGMRMPRRRPWPSRANALTEMLADIGVGTPIIIRYIHNGEIQEKEFVIEQAPRDMLSAAKYKNEKLGLTVKDLTYEVRTGLHLEAGEKAVVITEVEQGTPAALARINEYELIRAVDGQSVEDVAAFEKLIDEAQQAEKESVRLTVEYMGKTRLADLKFEAKSDPSMLERFIPGLR